MIRDNDGNEMVYWPIQGLVAGNNSQVLTITVDCPVDGVLKSSDDTRINVWARRKGVGASYVNIALAPIDLSALTGEVEFEIYLEAVAPIVGLERIPVSVMTSESSPADWFA